MVSTENDVLRIRGGIKLKESSQSFLSYYILFLYEETIDLTPLIDFVLVLFLIHSVALLYYHLT